MEIVFLLIAFMGALIAILAYRLEHLEAELYGEKEVVFEPLGDDIKVPIYGSEHAHGFDLFAPFDGEIGPGESIVIPMGFKMQLPDGYGVVIQSRSGLAAKQNIEKGAGLIDYDFEGEWKLVLRNLDKRNSFVFKKNDRIAQGYLSRRVKALFRVGKLIPRSKRGDGGLGSTGR